MMRSTDQAFTLSGGLIKAGPSDELFDATGSSRSEMLFVDPAAEDRHQQRAVFAEDLTATQDAPCGGVAQRRDAGRPFR